MNKQLLMLRVSYRCKLAAEIDASHTPHIRHEGRNGRKECAKVHTQYTRRATRYTPRYISVSPYLRIPLHIRIRIRISIPLSSRHPRSRAATARLITIQGRYDATTPRRLLRCELRNAPIVTLTLGVC